MSGFNTLWDFITKRRAFVVQEREELEYIFKLIQGCESYLEVGTAEGDSLYVLSHALKPSSRITSVDLGEAGTRVLVAQVIQLLIPVHSVGVYRGNSMDAATYPNKQKHDVVLIDGGHDYDTVKSDISMYAPLATKYLLFHDIKLPGVKQAVDEYVSMGGVKYHEFVKSPTMGFGIIEVQ